MLIHLMPKYGLELGLVSYVAAEQAEQQRIFSAGSPLSPAYFTTSRRVAKALRALHERVMSSTGGPNTMVATRLTPQVSTSAAVGS